MKKKFDLIIPPDLNEIRHLSDACYGNNYLPLSQLSAYLKDPTILGWKLFTSSTLIGFSFVKKITFSDLQQIFLSWPSFWPLIESHLPYQENLFLRLHTCILPSLQNKGNGKLLVTLTHSELLKHNPSAILSFVWDSANNKIIHLLSRLSFQHITTIPYFWHDDSIRKGYECKSCGNPCKCAAKIVIWSKK